VTGGDGGGLRIAWVSPLPPQRSGIADYSAELLPHLGAHPAVAEVTPYAESAFAAEVSAGELPVRPLSELPRRLAGGGPGRAHDGVVYHLGNNPDYHAETWRTARELPGVVVLHETMLHHLVRGITLDRGDAPAYLEEHRYAAGASGLAMAKRALDAGLPHDLWAYPLFERLVDRSLGVVVHNEAARRRVLASRPAAEVAVVPMPVDLSALPDLSQLPRAEARRRLGLPVDAFVVASFGFITPAKRLPVSLRAFARLRRRHPEAVYLLVGEVSPYYDLNRHLQVVEGEPGGGVRLTGRVSMETFLTAMVACDAAINLRHPTGGETSATLMRLLALGVPTLVTDHGSFREAPAGSVARVPLDDTEEDLLTAYLEALATDEALRQSMSRIGRDHVASHHTFEQAADAYVQALRHAFAAPAPPQPVAPLAPFPREDLPSELVSRISGAAGDLGAEEGDEVLERLARAVVELGLG
jgi:glycosyltransferase involved in cell wall biosynthesis